MKKLRRSLIWIVLLAFFALSVLVEDHSLVETDLTYDGNMRTEKFQVDVEVGEDQSYLVTEKIQVNFLNSRHGIYRYLPMKGYSETYEANGDSKKVPYYADIELLSANVPVRKDTESGYLILQMGSANRMVYGSQTYEIQYRLTPHFQTADYRNAYFNLLPVSWQNQIPQGSGFTIAFPADFNRSDLHLYCGAYGSTENGEDVLDLSWNGNTLKGTLNRDLPFGAGITMLAQMEEGYFTGVHRIPPVGIIVAVFSVAMVLLTGVLFFFFGKDEEIIPSIQYQPPEGLDSAAVGYIVDGTVQDRDILSLIIYWADRGYLRIEETSKNKLTLVKLSELPQDAPKYARIVFKRLFQARDTVKVDSLKYHFTDTIAASKTAVRAYVQSQGGIYTRVSGVIRALCSVLCMLPMGMFLLILGSYTKMGAMRVILYVGTLLLLLISVCLFSYTVDNWYTGKRSDRKGQAVLGIGVTLASCGGFGGSYFAQLYRGEVFDFSIPLVIALVSTVVMVLLTGFMRKRTHQCVEWMGRLAGLKDFIETAELDRLKVMAEENPQWFYHILPYTYVFDLSDIFAKKLEGLSLPAPQWYVGYEPGYRNYYYFHRSFMRSMSSMTTALTIAEPVKVSAGSGGGGFSGGGGGFSGGGFGGGGGGSW